MNWLQRKLKKALMPDARGMHPNTLKALKEANKRKSHGNDKDNIGNDGSVHDSVREGLHQGPEGLTETIQERDTPAREEATEEGGEDMNIENFFDLMGKYESMKSNIIQSHETAKQDGIEQAMEMLQDMNQGDSSPSFEDNMMLMLMQKVMGANSQLPANSPPTINPPLDNTERGEPVTPSFSMEQARGVAEILRSKLPPKISKMLQNGQISESEAVTFLSSWEIPPDNAKMIYKAFKGEIDEKKNKETAKVQDKDAQGAKEPSRMGVSDV